MEYYFSANRITSADKQRDVLISAMGAKAYITLRNLITPHNPSDKSFMELIEVTTKHFCPPLSEIVQILKFITRARKPGESAANYIAVRATSTVSSSSPICNNVRRIISHTNLTIHNTMDKIITVH